MGFTIRQGQLSKGAVRRDMDNYEINSLDDNMIVNGKSVKDRKKRREYIRDLTQRKRDMNQNKSATMTKEAPKQASFVDNNERIKQAAWVKLAMVRLAINYVMRNRLMSKQAAMPMGNSLPTAHKTPSMGYTGRSMGSATPMPTTGSVVQVSPRQGRGQMRSFDTIQNNMRDPRSSAQIRESLGSATKGIWDKGSGSYNFADGDWDAYQQERDRIERGWAQMNEAERAKYKKFYDRHINALDAWKGVQDYRQENPIPDNYSVPDYLPGIQENPTGSGWRSPSGSMPFVPKDMPVLEPIQYANPGARPFVPQDMPTLEPIYETPTGPTPAAPVNGYTHTQNINPRTPDMWTTRNSILDQVAWQ